MVPERYRKSAASLLNRVMMLPAVKGWLDKHPKLAGRVGKRLSTKEFTGLPLTLIGATFFYVVALFLGIVQDYLAHDPLIAADVRIANLLYVFRSDRMLEFFYVVTLSCESLVVIASAAVLTVYLFVRRGKVFAFALWLTLIPAEAATYLGKLLFHRGRPDVFLRAVSEDSYSFPSGHATTAAAFIGFMAYLLLRRKRTWKSRIAVVIFAAIAITLVDLSRLYLGVHYLSDVLAGNLVGFAALLFAIGATEWLIAKKRTGKPELFGWSGAALVAAVEICAVFILLKIAPLPQSKMAPLPPQEIAVADVLPLFQEGILPQYTETLTGEIQEPANLIIIAPDACFPEEVSASGWVQADTISLRSAEGISRAALLNTEYPTAPMTPSFYDAHPHDLGFEKETDTKTVRSRHHVRFWRTRYVTPLGTLYVGTVSLDTGIKWGVAHTISPDIDSERDLFVSDIKATGVVASDQIISFVKPKLGRNFAGDLFFTDGKAAFLTFQACKNR